MTVGELIKKLKDLPSDMKVVTLGVDGGSPDDVVSVTRGRWVDDIDDDLEEGFESMIEPENEGFIEDENGDMLVLVSW
jgi:hypothetical protein